MSRDLELLLVDGVIDEVLGSLKSGKEADVWLVRHGEEVIAAKVYKERHARNFKHNAGYKEGRTVRNTRTQRAMDRGSKFGQEASEEAWKSAEADALYKLHAAGVRVPAPVMFYEGVLLMQLVVDAEGRPAPRLIDAPITVENAAELYRDLRRQVVAMLCADLIHGDLSAYNVLVGAAGPTLIDFPQIIAAAHNSRAEFFFRRDLDNLRNHFAAIDPALKVLASGDSHEIWRAYVKTDLTSDFVPSGKPYQEPVARAPGPEGGHRGPRGDEARGPRPSGGGNSGRGNSGGGPRGGGQAHSEAGKAPPGSGSRSVPDGSAESGGRGPRRGRRSGRGGGHSPPTGDAGQRAGSGSSGPPSAGRGPHAPPGGGASAPANPNPTSDRGRNSGQRRESPPSGRGPGNARDPHPSGRGPREHREGQQPGRTHGGGREQQRSPDPVTGRASAPSGVRLPNRGPVAGSPRGPERGRAQQSSGPQVSYRGTGAAPLVSSRPALPRPGGPPQQNPRTGPGGASPSGSGKPPGSREDE